MSVQGKGLELVPWSEELVVEGIDILSLIPTT